jgi:hypothetical protein
MDDNEIWRMLVPECRPTQKAPVSHLLAILGTANSFTKLYWLSTKNKKLLIWRQWPGWLILSFCDRPSLLMMSLVSKQFLGTVYDTLEKIASSRLHRLTSGGVMKWVDEFAAFEQLKMHTASFGSSAYKEVDGSHISSGDTFFASILRAFFRTASSKNADRSSARIFRNRYRPVFILPFSRIRPQEPQLFIPMLTTQKVQTAGEGVA